jgi:hypothetical protein
MRRVARTIRENASRELKQQLDDATDEQLERVKADVRSSASSELPHRGGLAAQVAGGTLKVDRSGEGASLSMSVTKAGGKQMDLRALDAGRLRHPVHGVWRRNTPTQRVRSGWWSRPIERAKPVISRAMGRGAEDFARELARKCR